jgi:hypothetical protein
LGNKATAIINTARQRYVFFQFLEIKKLVRAASKTANLVEIVVKKNIFPQFSQKRIFPFCENSPQKLCCCWARR